MIIIKLNLFQPNQLYNKWLEESIKEDEETKIIYDVEKLIKMSYLNTLFQK